MVVIPAKTWVLMLVNIGLHPMPPARTLAVTAILIGEPKHRNVEQTQSNDNILSEVAKAKRADDYQNHRSLFIVP